jgi:hypothetical protein
MFGAVMALLPPAVWGQVRRGGEIPVNEFTTQAQYAPAVAADANGDFVVAWRDYGPSAGLSQEIVARRFDAAGSPLGPSFQVNAFTTGLQNTAAVASDPAGNVTIVWESPQDGSLGGIYARRFDASGNPVGATEFRVNAFTTGYQWAARVAAAADGSFMVVWTSNQDGSDWGVFARRYNAAGLPTTPTDIQVNSFTSGSQGYASVAADAAGNMIVAWSGSGSGDASGIFARRFDATGAPVGGEFQVNTFVTAEQRAPAVAAAPDGSFMVAWSSSGQDGSFGGVAARRYDASGTPDGSDFIVNTETLYDQGFDSVTADGDGNFVVVWTAPDGSESGLFGRRYDVSGAPGASFQINAYTTGGQYGGTVAAAPAGDFVVAWSSVGQDGSYHGIFAQRFSPDVIFRDDFESGTLARWSSTMTDGSDLAPSAFAALDFSTVGLQGIVDDTASLFVADEAPEDEAVYRARFWFDPNGFDPGESQQHLRTRIFIAFEEAPTRRLAAVVLRRQAGVYSLMGRARLDDNSQENTGFFPISDGPHAVEIAWRRSSGPAEEDGEFQMWIDGNLVSTRSNLDNSVSSVDFVRLGALSVKSGASGTMYWDEFESRRGSYIGP